MISSTKLFKQIFLIENLLKIYENKIINSGGCGIDGTTIKHFSKIKDSEIQLISKKSLKINTIFLNIN